MKTPPDWEYQPIEPSNYAWTPSWVHTIHDGASDEVSMPVFAVYEPVLGGQKTTLTERVTCSTCGEFFEFETVEYDES